MALNDYRTSVVYDFSIVEKAVFHIINDAKTEVIKSLPVQINPSTIKDNTIFRTNKNYTDIDRRESNVVVHKNSDDSNFEVDLVYHMYDEYNIRTMDGMLAVGQTALGGNPHLKNDRVTSLVDLQKNIGNRVIFVWGEIKVIGRLCACEVEYRQFSRWGEPLRADAKVTIAKENAYDAKDQILDVSTALNKMPMIKLKIKSYSLASRVVNEAALIASQANR